MSSGSLSINRETKDARAVEPADVGAIMEIVGPAGCGKSATLGALHRIENRTAILFRFSKKTNVSLLVRHSVPLSLLMLRLVLIDRCTCKVCIHGRMFLYLMRVLIKERIKESKGPIFVDEGPIFMLARMSLHDCPYYSSARASGFLSEEYAFWSKTLSGVAVLDAPDSVLSDRIRHREKPHVMKEKPEESLIRFSTRWRQALKTTTVRLLQAQALYIIHFDTSELSPDEIASRILQVLQ
jgi:hypothetical protein